MPTPKTFMLIFMNQYAKNKLIPLVNSILESSDQNAHFNMTISSICSGEIVHLQILQSDWQRNFGLYLKNKIFPKGFGQEYSK